jgi:hypothetical protein
MLRAPRGEVDIFLQPDNAPAWTRRWIPFWADLFAPYIKAGKFQSIEEDVVLTPGIRALATHGHAPGHTSYVVESKGQTLIVMGDLVLMGALQFANPARISPFRELATFAPGRDAISGRRLITQFLIRIPPCPSFFDPQRTLPGCQRIQKDVQPQRQEFPIRVNGENGDLRGRPLR